MEVHQLRADAIGVVHIELALPSLADLRRCVVPSIEAIAGFEHFVGVKDDTSPIESDRALPGSVELYWPERRPRWAAVSMYSSQS